MICANCGGTIRLNRKCEDCGIEYDAMLNAIEHPEIIRLFDIIEKKQKRHEDFTLEESLLACEFENSSFIIPAKVEEDSIGIVNIPGPKNGKYVAILTDMDEFGDWFSGLTPLTNSWQRVLGTIGPDSDGFVINPLGNACIITRELLDEYFGIE